VKPTHPLHGLVAAVHTPFRADGALHAPLSPARAAELRAALEALGFFAWIRG
jgi:hypothetical protein